MEFKVRLTYELGDKPVVQQILLKVLKYTNDGVYYQNGDKEGCSTIWVSMKYAEKVLKILRGAKAMGIYYELIGYGD